MRQFQLDDDLLEAVKDERECRPVVIAASQARAAEAAIRRLISLCAIVASCMAALPGPHAMLSDRRQSN